MHNPVTRESDPQSASDTHEQATGGNGPAWLRGWLRDSAVLYISQALFTASATFVMILLARELSVAQFGLFSAFLGLSVAVSFVIDAGLPTWLLRESARDYAGDARPTGLSHDRLWRAVYTLALTGAGATIVVVSAAYALGLSATLSLAQGCFVLYVASLAGATSLETEFRAKRQINRLLVAFLVEKLVLIPLVILALIAHFGVLGVGGAYVLAGGARALYDFWRTLRRSSRRPPLRSRPLDVIRRSAPFAATAAATVFLPRLDVVLVGAISVVFASYFAIGFQIVMTAFLVPLIASTALFPFLAEHTDTARMRRTVVVLMTAAGLLAAVVGYLLAPWVVPLAFGDKYRAAVTPVRVMLLSIPPGFLTFSLTSLMYADDREKTVVRALWVPGLCGTAIVVAGAIRFGASGAAAGFALRYVAQAVVLAILARLFWGAAGSGDTMQPGLGQSAAATRPPGIGRPLDRPSAGFAAEREASDPLIAAAVCDYVAAVGGPRAAVAVAVQALRFVEAAHHRPMNRSRWDAISAAARQPAFTDASRSARRVSVRMRHLRRRQIGHARVPEMLRRRADGVISERDLRRLYRTLERCPDCRALAARVNAAEWELKLALKDIADLSGL